MAKIDSIFDFSDKALGELKAWLEPWFLNDTAAAATPAPPATFSDWVLTLPGVWAYWPLQEASGDAIDQGALHADLQPVGTPDYQKVGPNTSDLPFAVRLTGSVHSSITDDSFYNTADGLSMAIRTSLTALCWIKPDSAASITRRLPIIGTMDLHWSGWGLLLSESTRQLEWTSGNGGGGSVDSLLGPPIVLDAWSLVGASRDGVSGDVRLYVNGSEVASDTTAFAFGSSGHGIRVGALDFDTSDPDAEHFYGDMAGAVFVDSVLSGADMLAAYTAGTSTP